MLVNRVGLSAEYIDKMPPVERGIYWEYYKKDLKEKAKREKGSPDMSVGQGLDTM